jgi:hypothetical protein
LRSCHLAHVIEHGADDEAADQEGDTARGAGVGERGRGEQRAEDGHQPIEVMGRGTTAGGDVVSRRAEHTGDVEPGQEEGDDQKDARYCQSLVAAR